MHERQHLGNAGLIELNVVDYRMVSNVDTTLNRLLSFNAGSSFFHTSPLEASNLRCTADL